MNSESQKYVNDYCKVEKKPTRFITVVGKPENIVCCTCSYGKTLNEEEEEDGA